MDISLAGITLLNNFWCAIFLTVAASLRGEFATFHATAAALRTEDIVWIVMSFFVGAGISFCGVWTQKLISATSFLVLVNANKFAILRIESLWAVAHGQAQLSWSQMAGACLVIASGIAYGKALTASKRESKIIGDSEDTPILQSIAHRIPFAVVCAQKKSQLVWCHW